MDLSNLTSGQLKILAYEQIKLRDTSLANLQVIEPLIIKKEQEERAAVEASPPKAKEEKKKD